VAKPATTLAARRQKIDKRARVVAKITDAEPAGQRRWMKQDAARSGHRQQKDPSFRRRTWLRERKNDPS